MIGFRILKNKWSSIDPFSSEKKGELTLSSDFSLWNNFLKEAPIWSYIPMVTGRDFFTDIPIPFLYWTMSLIKAKQRRKTLSELKECANSPSCLVPLDNDLGNVPSSATYLRCRMTSIRGETPGVKTGKKSVILRHSQSGELAKTNFSKIKR